MLLANSGRVVVAAGAAQDRVEALGFAVNLNQDRGLSRAVALDHFFREQRSMNLAGIDAAQHLAFPDLWKNQILRYARAGVFEVSDIARPVNYTLVDFTVAVPGKIATVLQPLEAGRAVADDELT